MSRIRVLKRLYVAFFAANAIFLVYPGIVPFSGARPFILGLPFPLVWVTAWIIGGFLMLLAMDSAYRARARDFRRSAD